MQDRDIELVLVTGAGASREFGVNGTKLPMMGEWSDALVDKLRPPMNYLAPTFLDKDLDGPEFEKRLGEFLHRAQAFKQIGPIVPHTAFQIDQGRLATVNEWYQQAAFHLDQILGLIHESLYEKFAASNVDIGAAAAAYSSLFAQLGVGAPSSLVVATTNYDMIAESAIVELGGLPDWGASPTLLAGAETPLRVDRLLDGFPRFTPVLHLHGRVGWFRRPDGTVYSSNHAVYQNSQNYGVPVVMLPDPDKTYDSEPVIYELWQQFHLALSRAKRVFVLGHSLHDKPLVDALRQYVQPTRRIAVGLLSADGSPEEFHASAGETMEIIRQNFPQAGMIPMRFGPSPSISRQQLELWDSSLKSDLAAE
jgi:hypothetical protein